MANDFPLTPEEFHKIYSKVPRLTVEVLLKGPEGVYLTLRDIEPCKGQWHLPGGTVYYGEYILDTVKRVAKREIGIEVKVAKNVGYIEYVGHFSVGLDHPFGMVFEVTEYTGEVQPNKEAAQGQWFKTVPENIHADQDVFLRDHGYLI
jgi:ADP-ribose pyrophosphatase YjhB (NUDIX family)